MAGAGRAARAALVARRGAAAEAGFSLAPTASFKYKNALYADHLATIERYKAEVLAAVRHDQAPGGRPASGAGEAGGEHARSQAAGRRRAEQRQEAEQQQELAKQKQEFADQKKEFEASMKDPAKAAAFRAAVKEYQEQFNHTVELGVRNGRELPDVGLDETGFVLLRHTSAVNDWDDADLVQRTYYGEMRDLVQGLVGASHCYVNRHNIRKSDGSAAFSPFMEVHSDFTDNYKEDLVQSLRGGKEVTPTFGMLGQLQADGVTAEELASSRLVVVHAWRSVSEEPLRRFPLALCDGRTVGQEELIRERVSGLERYRAMHSPSHKWYWFPDMRKDEVLLFKGFDSEQRRYAFHSAFVHPDACDENAHRFSCELRLICLIPSAETHE